jgi:hypothetical protein
MSDAVHKAARDVLSAWDHYGTAECLRGWIDRLRDALATDIGPEPAMVRAIRNVTQHYRNLNAELAAPTPEREPVALPKQAHKAMQAALDWLQAEQRAADEDCGDPGCDECEGVIRPRQRVIDALRAQLGGA